MRPIEVFQDEDKTITVLMNDSVASATEIEFRIDSNPQVIKTYTGGHITGISATGFTVQLDAADTADMTAGQYKMQARATIAGKKYNIGFTPDKLIVRDSVFVDTPSNTDYPSY